jgi:Uma2 family endonuclease
MSPTGYLHGGVEARIAARLDDFVGQRRLGTVMAGEVGVYTRRSPDTVRGADVLFISSGRLALASRTESFLDVAPELVVEVLSPEDRPGEVERKVAEYLEAGVLLVWLVNPATRTVRVRRPAVAERVLRVGETLGGEDVLPGFELALTAVFEE